MSILFINGSPNKKGNTARLAAALLGSRDYETLNLTDYRINVYGQRLAGDQFDEVMSKPPIPLSSVRRFIGITSAAACAPSWIASTAPLQAAACVARPCTSSSRVRRRNNGCSTQANSPCSALLSSMAFPGAVWRRRRGKRGRYLNKSEQRLLR